MIPRAGIPHPPEWPPDLSLWRVDIAFDAGLDDEMFSGLSEDELARAKSFHRIGDALRFATLRAALRELLADRVGVTPERVSLASGPFGRPVLVHEQSLDFNMSHSGSHGLIVLSSGSRVGVDIEMHATDFDWRTVADLALTPQERTHIEQLNAHAKLEAFYKIWVMKESILKATGVGLAEDLRHLSVSPERDGSTSRQYRLPGNSACFQAATLPAPSGYAACVAWECRLDGK
jgi:4'-phosphopantetheinyl transferase